MCGLEGAACPPAGPGEIRVASFNHLGERWQAIDTPGSIEFLHLASDALLAADAAVICVSPDPAQAVLAAPYLRLVEAAGTPAILFVNRMDEAEARVRDIVAALQDYAPSTRSCCGRCRSATRTATSPARSTSSPSGPGSIARARPRS
jgi:elongation factor G